MISNNHSTSSPRTPRPARGKAWKAALALGAFALAASSAPAAVVISGTTYTPTGSTETMSAVFTTPDGGVSHNTYSGYVEVQVSGTGQSFSTAYNDAFYLYTDRGGSPIAPQNSAYYVMTFGTTTLSAVETSADATQFMAYDLTAGRQVAPGYIPAYQSSHVYDFVLNTGTVNPAHLHFGVDDGQYGDNSGSYSIQLTQLAASPVPETSTTVAGVMGVGLVLGVSLLRRKTC